jgi:hypothetical protein
LLMEKPAENEQSKLSRTIEDQSTIDSARAAADRLTRREIWDDWRVVGRAFVIGRNEAMRAANTNQPKGSKYNRAFAQFLAASGLKTIALDGAARKRLFDLMEHPEEVEAWRQEKLTDDQRLAFNHPNTVWRRFNKYRLDEGLSSLPSRQSPFVTLKQSLAASEKQVAALQAEVTQLRSTNAPLTSKDEPSRVMEFLTGTYSEPTLSEISKLLSAFLANTFPDEQAEAGGAEKQPKPKRATKRK